MLRSTGGDGNQLTVRFVRHSQRNGEQQIDRTCGARRHSSTLPLVRTNNHAGALKSMVRSVMSSDWPGPIVSSDQSESPSSTASAKRFADKEWVESTILLTEKGMGSAESRRRLSA